MLFKCKICGGELNVQKGQSIVECEYCGVKQTLPRFLDENTKLMYDRANSYLLHNEFDKAENIYNQILLADKEDAEAYWNLVLCKYGVTYVKDPASGKYIPTCNRTHYASVFNDENYKNAIKYADAEKVELYKQDAKTIDDIQRGILSISKHEKPFDIFISYKETGENGARTKDSIKAQELYDKLTAEGYKVFFSRITLEDKIGTEYEPYIYAALASSKIMLVIGSSKDNLEAVWVKNEWSRYLSFAQRDSEKTLIPLYFDMDKADLPEEFAHLTAYDMTVDGFEQELIRGIKKLIPLPVMLLERKKKFRKKLKIAGVAVLVLAVIGGIASVPWFMKLPDYNAAMQLYYDKNYPEATWAFADLGSYRDSEEMKDKCERSWRNSLATVANAIACVSANGTIESFDGISSSLVQNMNINEHGAYVSTALGNRNEIGYESLITLQSDGYVKKTGWDSKADDNDGWSNVVQISDLFSVTPVALQADGTMTYDKGLVEENEADTWLTEISYWENIVAFDYFVSLGAAAGLDAAAIVGIKSDGSLCAVARYIGFYGGEYQELKQINHIIKQFNDIKNLDISYSWNTGLCIIALTNHNTVMAYINGEFSEFEVNNVIDVALARVRGEATTILLLNSDGTVQINNHNTVLLKDVIDINGDFAVTRSGSLYNARSDSFPNTYRDERKKVHVYDEWIERVR